MTTVENLSLVPPLAMSKLPRNSVSYGAATLTGTGDMVVGKSFGVDRKARDLVHFPSTVLISFGL